MSNTDPIKTGDYVIHEKYGVGRVFGVYEFYNYVFVDVVLEDKEVTVRVPVEQLKLATYE